MDIKKMNKYIGEVRHLLHAGHDIYEEHGLVYTLREMTIWGLGRIYGHRQYGAYHKKLSEVVGSAGMPPDGYELRILDSEEGLSDLIREKYSFNPYRGDRVARTFLGLGGTGFLLFNEKRLAAEAWIVRGKSTGTFRIFCEHLGTPEDIVFMDGVDTYEPHRRLGLQRYVMNKVFDYAKQKKLKEVVMLVKPHSIRARLLWESLGAVETEELDQVMVFGKCSSLTAKDKGGQVAK